MKLSNYIIYSLVLLMSVFTSCKDDVMPGNNMGEGEGEVVFRFFARNVYTINDINDIARLTVTLRSTAEGAESLVLPTVSVSKDGEEMVSEAIPVAAGNYEVEKYVAYDKKGDMLHEALLRKDNALTVVEGEQKGFYFPVSILSVESSNILRNKLFGICIEAIGPDSTKWPKTWREENEDLLTWENLEFETDDYGNISYLTGIIFDEKFAGMTKLPSTVSRLSTIESIVVNNIPEFEEIPEDINMTSLQSLTIINTSFKQLPPNFVIPSLYALTIIDSKMTEFPQVNQLEGLEHLSLVGNEIAEIPEDAFVAADGRPLKMTQLRIQRTKIKKLPASMFKNLARVNTFDLRDNAELCEMPVDFPSGPNGAPGHRIASLLLDGCAFTDIPEAVKGLKLLSLSMSGNKLSTVEFSKLSWDENGSTITPEILDFSNNAISSFGDLESSNLIQLSLNNCGLNVLPNTAKLPKLRLFEAAENNISSIANDQFKKNVELGVINLARNTSLASAPDDFGVYTENKTQINYLCPNGFKYIYATSPIIDIDNYLNLKEAQDMPINLKALNLDGCTALDWTVPSSWCCLENDSYFGGKGPDRLLPNRPVIVYNRDGSKVKYSQCWHEKCHYRNSDNNNQLNFRKDFDEVVEEAKEEANKKNSL